MSVTSQLSIDSRMKLNNNQTIPLLGLGVWQIPVGQPTIQVVQWALQAGYRLFDTARTYQNEASVGRAVQESGINREEIFVTTKLWPSDLYNPEKAFEKSLERLGLEYVDVYLIHWPVPGLEKRSWKALEKIYNTGLAKSIGVSNYNEHQLDEVLSIANIPPAIDQVEMSPFNYDPLFYEFCKKQDIAIEAYSPLTRGKMLNNSNLVEISVKYKKTSAQILIRWALQKDVVVIPKSANKLRIYENADVFDFEINQEDMKKLDELLMI